MNVLRNSVVIGSGKTNASSSIYKTEMARVNLKNAVAKTEAARVSLRTVAAPNYNENTRVKAKAGRATSAKRKK